MNDEESMDFDEDGVIEFGDDYVVIGNPHPDFTFGFSHNVRYQQFDLNVVMAGAIGQQIFELWKEPLKNFDEREFNVHVEALDRFRPGDDPTTKSIPTTVGNTSFWRGPNSNSVQDADYLFIKNIDRKSVV